LEEALGAAGDILVKIDARNGILNRQAPFNRLNLSAQWPGVNWRVAGTCEGDGIDDFRAFCAQADIGISRAEAALAETGTVVVHSGPGLSRLTALLPPIHLVLVPSSCLTTDIFTWTSSRHGVPPAALTLISGPSTTGDIEQTLTTGVHGPKRFIAILYDD
jgi:L-lactate utilization protein LutC